MFPLTPPGSVPVPEIQDPTTIDGCSIESLEEGQIVYRKEDEKGQVWRKMRIFDILECDRESGFFLLVPADHTVQNINGETHISRFASVRPTAGIVIDSNRLQSAYDVRNAIADPLSPIGQLTKGTRTGCNILLNLELADIDPVQLFESLRTEFPTTDPKEKLQPNQAVFIYDNAGTYVSATIIGAHPEYKEMWRIQFFDLTTRSIGQQFIQSELPDGKRACRTQEQLLALKMYAKIADSDEFKALDTEQQRLMLAGPAKAFLEE